MKNMVINDSENDSLISKDEKFSLASLEKYARHYLIENQKHTISKKEIVARVLAALFGAVWGTPWTNAASEAAIIFPSGLSRQVFEKIFAGGIVVTVGSDGLWVMLEIGKSLGSKSKEENQLLTNNSGTCLKISKIIFPALFSILSCIPSVYATVKYNEGAKKFLGIITLIGNLGYGFYGYHWLIQKTFGRSEMNKNGNLELENVKAKILQNIDMAISGKQDFSNKEELLKNIFDLSASQNKNETGCNFDTFKKGFQLTSTALISITSSLINIMLTKEFFEKNIYDNILFTILMATLTEVPNFVITSLSNYSALGRFFDFVFRRSPEAENKLAKEMYPSTTFILSIALFFISLTAPTAGAYITYNTLSQENTNTAIKWIATSAIIAARLIFSNFTMNRITRDGLLTLHDKKNPEEDKLNTRTKLIRFKEIVSNTNITFFNAAKNNTNELLPTNENSFSMEFSNKSFSRSCPCAIL